MTVCSSFRKLLLYWPVLRHPRWGPYYWSRPTQGRSKGWFCGFNPYPEILTKFDQFWISLFTVTPPPRKPMMMYGVSYFCTKMHHFKAKKNPHPARVSVLPPYWTPTQMKFLATAWEYCIPRAVVAVKCANYRYREISLVNETKHLTPILAVVFVLLGNAVTQ